MSAYIVIPAYNEGAVIRAVLARVRPLYPNVIVVDDASSDDTAEQAGREGVIVLRHHINRGQGASLKTGIACALELGADYIVTFDSDGQHRVEDIARVLEPLQAGTHDVVLGSRFLGTVRNMPGMRRLVLQLGVLFTRFVSHINVTDTHNGLRGFTRHAAKRIRIVQDRMAHASEILEEIVRQGLRYTEVPVTIAYTEYSQTKGQRSTAMFKIAMKFLISKFLH